MEWALALTMALIAVPQPAHIFVARPGQIVVLRDLNHDGDFLDAGESTLYADALGSTPRGLALDGPILFAIDPANAAVLKIADLNGDGDALDFGEVTTYAQFPTVPATNLFGLTRLADGSLVTLDTSSNSAWLLRDLNHDGDALDVLEIVSVAAGFSQPIAAASRGPDSILVAQNSGAVPVRILQDRNRDGDFLDFAENISYVETGAVGSDIFVDSLRVAYMVTQSGGQVVRLHDLTGDDDALDFGEIEVFASGLPIPHWISGVSGGALFVACDDAAGSVYRLEDLNGDGDALDLGEAIVVAQGLIGTSGMIAAAAIVPDCIAGDFNDDGLVNLGDVADCVSALLAGAGELCRADINGDGLINGRDIGVFVELLIP